MNLFNGVDPYLDLRDMPKIRQIAEAVTKLNVHERHPYAGDLVLPRSLVPQDAIKKGMAKVDMEKLEHWEVPYLPIDPGDVGSSYKETVRVNVSLGRAEWAYCLRNTTNILAERAVSRIQFERAKFNRKP